MIATDIYMFYALLISNALLLAAATIVVLRVHKQMQKNEDFWNSPTGAAVQEESLPTEEIGRIVDQRLFALDRIIDELVEADGRLRYSNTSDLPFGNAVRMVKQGASVDELTRMCGLSEGEALLMTRIHADDERTGAR